MGKHPTHVRLLVNKLPNYVGYSDSCGISTWGVWTSGLKKIGSIIWQLEYPQTVKEIFMSSTLAIKIIDLSGMVLNWLALECITSNLAHTHASLLISGYSLSAGHLLRLLSMGIHATKLSHLTPIGIAG